MFTLIAIKTMNIEHQAKTTNQVLIILLMIVVDTVVFGSIAQSL